jgi:glycosyltransferase involved in cell wall biosynthesis
VNIAMKGTKNGPTKKILYIDMFSTGHRPQHVRWISKMAKAERLDVTFLLPAAIRKRLDEDVTEAKIIELPDSLSHFSYTNKEIVKSLRAFYFIRKVIKKHGFSHIYFMHLDTFLITLPLLRLFTNTHVTGLYFTPAYHYEKAFQSRLTNKEKTFSILKEILLSLSFATGSINHVQSFDKYYVAFRGKETVTWVPDLCEPLTDINETLGSEFFKWMNSRGPKAILFGAIASRKGIIPLLNACTYLKEKHGISIPLLIAGNWEGDQLKSDAIKNISDNFLDVYLVDRFLSSQEVSAAVNESNIVLATYIRHFGTSGILSWAGLFQKALIGQSFGVIGKEIEEYNLGITVDPEDKVKFAEALAFAYKRKCGLVDKSGSRRFVEERKPEEFARAMLVNFYKD